MRQTPLDVLISSINVCVFGLLLDTVPMETGIATHSP